ncbi:unnamed protein product [Brassica oleracea var. botrytis]
MAISRILLSDLKAGRCSNNVEMRLLRSWEARNVKKGGELMWIDLLFVDEKVAMTMWLEDRYNRETVVIPNDQLNSYPVNANASSES